MEGWRLHALTCMGLVLIIALLSGTQSNAIISESGCGLTNSNPLSPAIALEEKTKNLLQDLRKIHEEIKENNTNLMANMKEAMVEV